MDKPIKLLSGGERARVAISKILLDRPNVLIMDEPTNHLDINSCEALEGALTDFDGTVICVSHDRYFLDKVAQRLLIITPPNIDSFDGNYTAWNQHLAKKAAAAVVPPPPRHRPAPKPVQPQKQQQQQPRKKTDNPWSRPFGRLTVPELEKQIAQTESDIARCQETRRSKDRPRSPAQPRTYRPRHRPCQAIKGVGSRVFCAGGAIVAVRPIAYDRIAPAPLPKYQADPPWDGTSPKVEECLADDFL